MKAGGHGIQVINKTNHGLSHADKDALKANVAKGAGKVTQVIVEETQHRNVEYHALALKYVKGGQTFLYCKAAGGNFSDVLEQLKTCKKE